MASEWWGKPATTVQKEAGSRTNVQVLLASLKVCSKTRNLQRGKQVHADAVECGHDCNIYVANALIHMYGKCGSMVDACRIFDCLKKQSTVASWTSLILGYAENGQGEAALVLFTRMKIEGPAPDSVTLVAALKGCMSLAALKETRQSAGFIDRGKEIHSIVVENDCTSDVYVQSTLIDMYAKSNSMVAAREVFDCMKHPNIVSWNVLILGYVDNGQAHIALDMFSRMGAEGPAPDPITLMAAMKACTSLALKEASGWAECQDRGKQIHNVALENGNSDVYVESALVDMYAKCGSMVAAWEVFNSMKHPTVVSWTAIILGYTDNGQGNTALDIFSRMIVEGPTPDSVTVVAALKACTSLAVKSSCGWVECRDRGTEIYNCSVEIGCNSDIYVQSTLLDMYAKCGSMVGASELFDSMKYSDVVSWNALILGYAENGQGHTALDFFARMRSEGPAPDSVTMVAALKACITQYRDVGKVIHDIVIENGYSSDVHVQSTLVDMYAKCGSMVDASKVFDDMKHPDVVSWTALILGYIDNGQGNISLDIFSKMRKYGPAPDSVTLVAALKASTSLGVNNLQSMDRGKEIHNIAVENGCNSDSYLESTLVDMYSKCGSMVDAQDVFDSIKHPDVVSWNVLISGYVDNSRGQTALDMFIRMETEGPSPNNETFGAALKACSLVGALDFGKKIHSKFIDENDGDVVMLTCLVDFYAKCGSLLDAQRVFDVHTGTRNTVTWNALLSGFSSCGDNKAVFGLFSKMLDSGLKPDGVTFTCILNCCSHAGLLVKGKECFDAMSTKYGVIPNAKHYTCMIDLFGRANKLDDAMAMLKHMPYSPDDVTWRTILGACRKWKNVEVGKLAFNSLIDLNDKDAAAYVLMGQIYGSRGMLQEQRMVIRLGKKLRDYKEAEKTYWTNEAGVVHIFSADNRHFQQLQDIHEKWESMVVVIRQLGYTINLRNETIVQKEECCHSERLALVCGLINTHPGKTVRIVKNFEVCDDCHFAITLVSKIECRTIICRDASRIHCFKAGKCSCE